MIEEKNNPAVHYNLVVMYYFKYEDKYNNMAIEHFGIAHNCSEIQLKARAHSGLANAIGQKYHRYKSIPEKEVNKQLNLAIKHGEISINLNPDLDASQKAVGFIYHQMSEYLFEIDAEKSNEFKDKAITHYDLAINLNNEHFGAYNNLGNLYLEYSKKIKIKNAKQDFLDKAISNFESAIKINPTYHFAYDNLANAYYEKAISEKDDKKSKENFENAKENYLNALIYQPDYFEAKNDFAMLYLNPDFKQDVPHAVEEHESIIDSLKAVNETRMLKLSNQFKIRAKDCGVDLSEYDL